MGGGYGAVQMGGFGGSMKTMGDSHACQPVPNSPDSRKAWNSAGAANGAPNTTGSSNQMGGFPAAGQQMG